MFDIEHERREFEGWAVGPDGPWTLRAVKQRVGETYGPPELAIQWDCWLAAKHHAAAAQTVVKSAETSMDAHSVPLLDPACSSDIVITISEQNQGLASAMGILQDEQKAGIDGERDLEAQALAAFEVHLDEQRGVAGMPGLSARPAFIAGYMAGRRPANKIIEDGSQS